MSSTLTGMTVREIRERAEYLAKDILEAHWSEATFPVDPVQIARRIGVEVFSAQLGNDVFGMLIGNEEGSEIYVDVDQPANRYRFTVAHELGHYGERGSRLDNDVAFIDKRSDEDRGNPDEVFANHFAGALLMPCDALKEMIDQGFSDVQIARAFGVSLSALGYRRMLLHV